MIMITFETLYTMFDPYLIFFYRMTNISILGYLFGTFCLAMICVVTGRMTYSAAWRWNRNHLQKDSSRMIHMHNLSFRALWAKDKKAYKACNKEANDAFGKYFFFQMALGMSSLWPVPFALGWMDFRFGKVDFPLLFSIPGHGDTVGYTFTFIPLYILAVILFNRIKAYIPYFKLTEKMIQEDKHSQEKMLSLADMS